MPGSIKLLFYVALFAVWFVIISFIAVLKFAKENPWYATHVYYN